MGWVKSPRMNPEVTKEPNARWGNTCYHILHLALHYPQIFSLGVQPAPLVNVYAPGDALGICVEEIVRRQVKVFVILPWF
jgi:hypothetical protein